MNSRRSILTLALLAAAACAGACGGGGRAPASSSDQLPEITLDTIYEDINGEYVKVPAADGKSKPFDPWVFDRREKKQIEIVEQKMEGEHATFLVNMQTHTTPRSRNPASLSGQLRLHYRLDSGLVLRKWEIDDVENVSFKYVKEEPPPDDKKAGETGERGEDEDGGREPPPPPPPAPGANDNAKNAKPAASPAAKPAAKRNAGGAAKQ